MSMTIHERPGVYSSYDASTVINGSGGGSTVGLVGLVTDGESGKLYTFNRYEDAVTQFGQEENLTKLVQVLFRNGAARVVVVPVSGEEDYQGAFDLLAMEDDIDLVVCDSTQLSVQQALRQSVCDASQARRERIAVVGGAQSEDVEALVERAEGSTASGWCWWPPETAPAWQPPRWRGPLPGRTTPPSPWGARN